MIAASQAMRALSPLRIRGTRLLKRRAGLTAVVLLALLSSLAWTQQSAPPAAAPASPAPEQQTPEITSHEENPTFKVKVNLVEVRVVVRDAQGKAVGNLNKDDFLLTDNGKPQVITRFSVEKAGDQPLIQHDQVAAVAPAEKAAQPAATPAVALPQRYIAFLFDDIHLRQSDLVQARNAAVRQMQSLRAVDRAAIFTTSGQGQLDFTDDRAQLVAALNRLVPRPTDAKGVTECPNISYYMADLIINREDLQATQMARQDAADCGASTTQGEIRGYAIRALTIGDQEVRLSLGVLRDVVRRISGMPGQRLIILVSPGFMNRDELQEQTQIGERALHSGVVISALDARGLYTDMPDVSETRNPSPTTAGKLQQYHTAELEFDSDILADFADATGGTFFHNNNDLDEGFRRLAAAPEFSYLLGFAPQNLKLDGHFHKLKVTLKKPASGVVQARKGYYAPKGTADPGEQAKQAFEDAVFSQEEVREIPVELHTQFFKASDDDAKLSVVVRMDVRHVHFRKADGRNNNDVTVVSAVFDRNGNFVSGSQKVLQLHLKDETLQGRLGSGITLKSSFDVKPGSYIVRLVVRDEDGQLATQNSAVQIP